MKKDQKINLICRMAGNIKSSHGSAETAVESAVEIFKKVEEEVEKMEQEKGAAISTAEVLINQNKGVK